MTDPTGCILLAAEDAATRTFLADNLTADGYEMLVAEDKTAALAQLTLAPDLVLCDVNGDTLDLIDAVRGADGFASRIDADTPLIILTGRVDALMRVRYFERGGDDVVAKPFCYPELLARIRAVLRRSRQRVPRHVLRIGELVIDTVARDVRIDGSVIELCAKEYALLVHLAGAPTKVFTKDELMRDIWGFQARGSSRTLDSHAARLRHKLRAHAGPHWVENIWGVGYRLVSPDGPERSAA
jgi:DNA-binding response OmpR family regulator